MDIQLVCASPQMQRIATTIRMGGDRPLLLTGETGVGKDALASWAHSISPNAAGPLVCINCAAIQESLWESEIFGHVKGAFTGAVSDKAGQVESAEDGTLFLNEIGDMPLPTQAKLLTFLDTHEFQRVGDVKTRRVRTWIIAATNKDLAQAIGDGRFRQDLFYRLAVVHAHIPPLRERPEDILALAMQQLQAIMNRLGRQRFQLDPSARQMLVGRNWRGNVRELQAATEMAFNLCDDAGQMVIFPEHFPPEWGDTAPSGSNWAGSNLKERSPTDPVDERPAPGSPVPSHPTRAAPAAPNPEGDILADPAALKELLDRYRTGSGRWNISVVHRVLFETGRVRINRRAFADRVKQLFPNGEDS